MRVVVVLTYKYVEMDWTLVFQIQYEWNIVIFILPIFLPSPFLLQPSNPYLEPSYFRLSFPKIFSLHQIGIRASILASSLELFFLNNNDNLRVRSVWLIIRKTKRKWIKIKGKNHFLRVFGLKEKKNRATNLLLYFLKNFVKKSFVEGFSIGAHLMKTFFLFQPIFFQFRRSNCTLLFLPPQNLSI